MEETTDPNPFPSPRRNNRDLRAPRLRLDILDAEHRLDPARLQWLRSAGKAALEAALAGEGRGEGEHQVRLLVVGDARMSELHERHMGVAGPTDVLTFDLRDSAAAPLDTDIAVCVDEAARQAGPRGLAPERELLLYFVHGVLHCLGHDDHSEADSLRMHAREDDILRSIGVGATFYGAGGEEDAGAPARMERSR